MPNPKLIEADAYMWTFQFRLNGRQTTNMIPSSHTPEQEAEFIEWIEFGGGIVLKIKSIEALYYRETPNG